MAGFTNLRITDRLYRELCSLAFGSYPNEVFALIAGYKENGWNYATNIARVKIYDSSPHYVNFSATEIITVSNHYCIIGQYHSHPRDQNNCDSTKPSRADLALASSLERKLRKPIYMMILSLPTTVLSCWLRGEHVNFEIIGGVQEETIFERG